MPNIKSAKKRVKVIATKTARNKAINSNLKSSVKKANIAIETGASDKDVVVKSAIKTIDEACTKGVLHKNNAAHKKSQLMKKLNAAS